MPLYKNTVTGNSAVLTEMYVRAFPDGVFELVEKESVLERAAREHQEALDHKVDLETADEADEASPAHKQKKGDK